MLESSPITQVPRDDSDKENSGPGGDDPEERESDEPEPEPQLPQENDQVSYPYRLKYIELMFVVVGTNCVGNSAYSCLWLYNSRRPGHG